MKRRDELKKSVYFQMGVKVRLEGSIISNEITHSLLPFLKIILKPEVPRRYTKVFHPLELLLTKPRSLVMESSQSKYSEALSRQDFEPLLKPPLMLF